LTIWKVWDRRRSGRLALIGVISAYWTTCIHDLVFIRHLTVQHRISFSPDPQRGPSYLSCLPITPSSSACAILLSFLSSFLNAQKSFTRDSRNPANNQPRVDCNCLRLTTRGFGLLPSSLDVPQGRGTRLNTLAAAPLFARLLLPGWLGMCAFA